MATKSQIRQATPPGNRIAAAWKKAYERFLKIRGTPREIALGFALGLFVGMTPFMGVQMAIAVFFAVLLKWNKLSSAAGVWISNPLTAPVLYPITYYVGAKMVGIREAYRLPEHMEWSIILRMLQKTPEIISLMILGGVILGVPIAVAGYFFAFSAVQKYQDRIKPKLAEHKVKAAEKKSRRRNRRKRKK
jgi:uncharacterized protein (DUF2062 family)